MNNPLRVDQVENTVGATNACTSDNSTKTVIVYIPTYRAEPLGVCESLDSARKVLEKKVGRKISSPSMTWKEQFQGWECFVSGMYVGMIWKRGMCR